MRSTSRFEAAEIASRSSSSRPIILVTRSSTRQVLDQVLAHQLAVAQHGHAVGDLVHLLEEVAHEQDGHACGPQLADDGEQLLDLAPVQAGRGLVEDQDPGVEHHGATDRDQLLDGQRVAGQHRAGVDLHAEAPQVRRRPARARPSSRSGRRGRGSWPSITFSPTDRFGQRFTSWYTVEMPATWASAVVRNTTGARPRRSRRSRWRTRRSAP